METDEIKQIEIDAWKAMVVFAQSTEHNVTKIVAELEKLAQLYDGLEKRLSGLEGRLDDVLQTNNLWNGR